MPRKASDIDMELTKAVERRNLCRERISVLSNAIVQDTRLIDLLLTERVDLMSHS